MSWPRTAGAWSSPSSIIRGNRSLSSSLTSLASGRQGAAAPTDPFGRPRSQAVDHFAGGLPKYKWSNICSPARTRLFGDDSLLLLVGFYPALADG
jgi:hypothetical protein